MSRVPSRQCQSSPSQGLHQIRYGMSLSSTGDRMKDGFKFGSAVRLHVGFEFENGRIDRWARGDLDTSQGRGIEPFASNAWFSNCFRVCKDRRSIPVLILSRHCTSTGVTLQSCQALQVFSVNQVHRKVCIRSVTACRHQALATVWMTVLKSAVPSVSVLDFEFENDTHHRGRGE